MSLEVAPVTLSLIVVLNSVILNLPDPTSHNIPYLPWPPGGQGLAFDHTLIWRCDVTATSCCPRRLSTCRTIAVTIIVSPPSVRLPTASCCHLQENNEQYMAYERKHFEGRLKVHQLPSIQPRTPSLSCQCSSTERHQPDNHQPSPSSICPACLFTFLYFTS